MKETDEDNVQLADLLDLLETLDKLQRDERQHTKGPNHVTEMVRAEMALEEWQSRTRTPLERWLIRLRQDALPDAVAIWPDDSAQGDDWTG